MPRPISRQQVNEILAAPADEKRQHTADRVGVSDTTVANVLADPAKYLNRAWRGPKSKRVNEPSVHVDRADAERCPGCGYLVKMPCVYCSQESKRETMRKGL